MIDKTKCGFTYASTDIINFLSEIIQEDEFMDHSIALAKSSNWKIILEESYKSKLFKELFL